MLTGSGAVLVVALGFVALAGFALAILLRGASPTGELQERLHTYAFVPDEAPQRRGDRRAGRFYRLRRRLNVMLAAIGSEDLNVDLMAANWRITVTEYVLIRLGLMAGGLASGWLVFGSPVSGVALALLANLVPAILLRRAIHRRRLSFEAQLVDTLVLIQGAVRAGFSLLQAVEVVEREMEPPASVEFQRVTREVSLGLTLSQALSNLDARMRNPDLALIVTAVNIHNQVGGNLVTMLNAVTETVRDRDRLFREARVITTQQRYTSYLLSLLPVFLAGIMFMISPEYITQLLRPGIYVFIPIFAALGIIAGHIVLQRITKIEV
jgi:tight adherence protein B